MLYTDAHTVHTHTHSINCTYYTQEQMQIHTCTHRNAQATYNEHIEMCKQAVHTDAHTHIYLKYTIWIPKGDKYWKAHISRGESTSNKPSASGTEPLMQQHRHYGHAHKNTHRQRCRGESRFPLLGGAKPLDKTYYVSCDPAKLGGSGSTFPRIFF